MSIKAYYVYIMSNQYRTVFYIGVTNNIQLRTAQHRMGQGSLFTSKYKCYYLLYFEEYFEIKEAISREKQLKNWHRQWKINLIKQLNPEMADLAEKMVLMIIDAETSSA